MNATAMKPTVVLVDDEKSVRDSLRYLIESVGLAVETFSSAEEFLVAFKPDRAGCLVLDVRMPGMGGLELQSKLAQSGACLPIIILTAYADVPMAVRALSNGALYFMEKPFSDQELLDRIQSAIALSETRLAEQAQKSLITTRLSRLTPRERSVLELVVSGRQNKEIARSLGLSEKTIEVHRAHVMDKMEAGGVAELVRMTHSHLPARPNGPAENP